MKFQLPPMITKWLQENVSRMSQKSPKFFRWWGMLSTAFMLISGIPYVLELFETVWDYTLPEPFNTLSNKAVLFAAMGIKFMSMMPVNTPIVGQTTEGAAVKVTDESKLPFTAKAEGQKIEESVPPKPVLPSVPEVPLPEKKEP